MSRKVYEVPFWSRAAIFIADRLPVRVRASVCIDMLDGLDESYEWVHTEKDGVVNSFGAVSAFNIETIRREAYKDALKCKTRVVSDLVRPKGERDE